MMYYDDRPSGRGNHRHLMTIYSTQRWQDWFIKRYWTACWTCDFKDGPHVDWQLADAARKIFDKQ